MCTCCLIRHSLFVPSGKFDIYVEVDGKRKLVGSYNNEGFFGELALMYNMPRAATIVAATDGTVWGLVCTTHLHLFVSTELSDCGLAC